MNDATGRQVDYATAAPSGITWVNGTESFANVVVQPTSLYYHPFVNLHPTRSSRYVRITNIPEWNIGEIEFRLLRRNGILMRIR